jgi:hypothetical protein
MLRNSVEGIDAVDPVWVIVLPSTGISGGTQLPEDGCELTPPVDANVGYVR